MEGLSVLTGPVQPFKPALLHKIVEKVAEDFPDNIAVISEDESVHYTYQQLRDISNRLSKAILGICPRTNPILVAVCMHPSEKLIALLLAIWKAGGAYLPLHPCVTLHRTQHIVKEAKPSLVVYEDEENVQGLEDVAKVSVEELFNCYSDEEPGTDAEEAFENLAVVMFTSGSTGTPKGVRLTHASIQNRLEWQFRTFPFEEDEARVIFKTSLTFVDHIAEIWGPLAKGLAVVVVSRTTTQNPEKLVGVLEKHHARRLMLVSSLFRTLLAYLRMQGKKRMKALQLWMCTGEVLPVGLVEDFYKLFPKQQLYNFYGCTEVTGDATFHHVEANSENIPIGNPIDNTEIYVLDNDLNPVPIGKIGEIYISGSLVSPGYINPSLGLENQPTTSGSKFSGNQTSRRFASASNATSAYTPSGHFQLAQEKFIDNPFSQEFNKMYRTGDFGRIANGTLMFEGRADSQVKVRGQRVDLSEVEKVVSEIQGVTKATVLFHSPRESDQAILAFVSTDGSTTEEDVERCLPKRLVSYMVPEVVLVEEFPLLVNGKVDRQELLRLYCGGSRSLDYTGVPEELMESARVLFETVASLSKALRKTKIGPESNFFDVGGNSLNSIFTISRLREAGYYIGVDEFVTASTLKEILIKLSKRLTIPDNHVKSYQDVAPYTTEPMQDHHKPIILDIMSTTYHQKCPLVKYLNRDVSPNSYREMLEQVWKSLLEQNLGFMVKSDDAIVGASINYDACLVPSCPLRSNFRAINEFLEELEDLVFDDYVAEEGAVLYSAWIGTCPRLSPGENIRIFRFAEEENQRLAQRRGFRAIFTSNVISLSQELATDLHGYEVLVDQQINEYVAEDGSRPFGSAPDSERVLVQWKNI